MKLVVEVYRLVKILPNIEIYALSDQMRRAVISIPSNIAEGYGRNSNKEYSRFLKIARGSCFELDTQLEACILVGYVTEDKIQNALALLNEIIKMLTAILKKLDSEY